MCSPGLVETDMAEAVAAQMGIPLKDLPTISTVTSAADILSVVDAATKESHGGKFWNHDGKELTY